MTVINVMSEIMSNTKSVGPLTILNWNVENGDCDQKIRVGPHNCRRDDGVGGGSSSGPVAVVVRLA